MKFIPYFEEIYYVNFDEPGFGHKINQSKLSGVYANHLLKLQRKTWLRNAFRPVAVCYPLNKEEKGQKIKLIVRPDGFGLGFICLWSFPLIVELFNVMFQGLFGPMLGLIGLLFLGYLLLMIGFWIEVPLLKRELNRLFLPNI